jgi:alpha-aminoadipate carrier protein LysW
LNSYPRYIIRCRVASTVLVPPFANNRTEDGAVIRCPECSAEIDVDEDEIEEGEILSCPECESELEVSQTHPVHLNLISDDLDEEEEDEEEEGEVAENGDVLDEDEEEEEDEE